MKHLFYIHSGITLSLSLEVIKEKELNLETCIFLITRFNPENLPQTVQTIYLDDHFNMTQDFLVSPIFIKPLINTLKFNKFINQYLKGSNFHAYIPVHYMNRFYLLTNHPKCKQFSYVEEGTISYLTPLELEDLKQEKKGDSIIKRLIFKLCFNGQVPRDKSYFLTKNSKLKEFFTLSEYAFPFDGINKTILSLPFKKIKMKENVKHLLVVERYFQIGLMSIENYKLCLERYFDFFLKQGIEEFHFKYHPAQSPLEIELFEQLIEQNTNIKKAIKIDDNCTLEDVIHTYRPAIYHINSSVGIYACIMNCKVFTILDFARNQTPPLKSNGLPVQLRDKAVNI